MYTEILLPDVNSSAYLPNVFEMRSFVMKYISGCLLLVVCLSAAGCGGSVDETAPTEGKNAVSNADVQKQMDEAMKKGGYKGKIPQ